MVRDPFPRSYNPPWDARSTSTPIIEDSMLTLQEQLEDAAELMQQANHILVLTGAGISTESGTPDFRSPGSIWQQPPPVSYQDFISKPEARQRYWQTRHRLSAQVAAA